MFQNNYTYDVCHEHLYDFGLINMNGRVYDPLTSSFLSPDIYVQDPTTQQGFNRYAYCMYNPLKYVDPSGYRYFGWDPGFWHRIEQQMKAYILNAWHQHYDSSMASHRLTMLLSSFLYSRGPDTNHGSSGNHGTPGGDGYGNISCEAHQSFDNSQLENIESEHGICVFGGLGSTCNQWEGAYDTQEWMNRANEYGQYVYRTNYLRDFIIDNNYECELLSIDQICDAMNDGYVVSAWVTLTDELVDFYNLNGTSHYVNISDRIMYDTGYISLYFNDFPSNSFMVPYGGFINPPMSIFNTTIYHENNNITILQKINFYKIKPNWP